MQRPITVAIRHAERVMSNGAHVNLSFISSFRIQHFNHYIYLYVT
jgi:hypothetical protein